MCAEKAKTCLLIAGLSVAVLLGSAPAVGPAMGAEGVSCRVEHRPMPAEDILPRGKNREQVGCPDGLVLTGGGAHCGISPLTTGLDLPSSAYPDGDPAQWVCTWENTSPRTARCQCDAICCSEGSTQPAQCAHDLCSQGVALEQGPPACETCVDTVCACDPFCCTNSWDGFCVHEAQQLCGKTCGSNNGCLATCGC